MPARVEPDPNTDTLPLGQAPGQAGCGCAWLLPRLADRHCGEVAASPLAKRAMHLLRDHCVGCHNPNKTKGDLDHPAANRAGRWRRRPGFCRGQPRESRLIQFLKPDSDPHMPPKKQLSDEHIATLSRWVAAGAEWLPKELDVKNRRRLPNWATCREGIGPCLHSLSRLTTSGWLPATATR